MANLSDESQESCGDLIIGGPTCSLIAPRTLSLKGDLLRIKKPPLAGKPIAALEVAAPGAAVARVERADQRYGSLARNTPRGSQAERVARSCATCLGRATSALLAFYDGTMHAACLVLAATVAATTAEPSVAELNTGAQESNPFWTSDGLILYFDSDRAGSRELWVATRPHLNDAFSPAVMVAGIAAVGENKDPWLSADGRRLYFSSSRAGSFELFMAERP